jgi:hypothetical protein
VVTVVEVVAAVAVKVEESSTVACRNPVQQIPNFREFSHINQIRFAN